MANYKYRNLLNVAFNLFLVTVCLLIFRPKEVSLWPKFPLVQFFEVPIYLRFSKITLDLCLILTKKNGPAYAFGITYRFHLQNFIAIAVVGKTVPADRKVLLCR